MEEEGIGLVLARATELRLKISNCIQRATANGPSPHADDDDDEATERLLNICDALEALETQLSSLQVPSFQNYCTIIFLKIFLLFYYYFFQDILIILSLFAFFFLLY